MHQNWKSNIINTFNCPCYNGFTEGADNKIKVIKQVDFGYRNFKNFRTRILFTANG